MKYYLNNNGFSNMFGKMKIFNENKNAIGKATWRRNVCTLLNNSNQFVCRIYDNNGTYSMCFDQNGNDVEFELARKGKFKIGFGLGHFMLLPIASIPYGAYYGVSKYGDIYIRRNGLCKDVYINDVLIAKARIKTNYLAMILSSKSYLEMFTDDAQLTKYALAILLVMETTQGKIK